MGVVDVRNILLAIVLSLAIFIMGLAIGGSLGEKYVLQWRTLTFNCIDELVVCHDELKYCPSRPTHL